MLYRIKDFESVYNISENKFKHMNEDFSIKRSIEDIVDIVRSEIKKKNIELEVNHGNDIPHMVKNDVSKFK